MVEIRDDIFFISKFGALPLLGMLGLITEEGVDFLLEHRQQIDGRLEEEALGLLDIGVVVRVHHASPQSYK